MVGDAELGGHENRLPYPSHIHQYEQVRDFRFDSRWRLKPLQDATEKCGQADISGRLLFGNGRILQPQLQASVKLGVGLGFRDGLFQTTAIQGKESFRVFLGKPARVGMQRDVEPIRIAK